MALLLLYLINFASHTIIKMKIKNLSVFFFLCFSSYVFSQVKEIELLKSEEGNVITYYAKSNTREPMTVEMNVEGTGFTSSATMPAVVNLKSFEKKEIVKLTLDPSGASSYSVSYKQYGCIFDG